MSPALKHRLVAAWPWLAAALSGVLLGLCFPRWDVGELIWIWQVPLFAALWFSEPRSGDPRRRWRHGLALGYVAGLTFFLINLSWLFELRRVVGSVWAGIGAWVGLPAYLALYFAIFGAFAATVGRWKPGFGEDEEKKKTTQNRRQQKLEEAAKRRGLKPDRGGFGMFPVGDLFGPSMNVLRAAALCGGAWCGLEWLRGIAFSGFGWNGLGVALHESLYLIQIADIVGVTGLAFLIVFCNAVWTATLVRIGREMAVRQRIRPHLDFALAMLLIIGVFLYGLTRFATRPEPDEENSVSLRALLVQLNTPIDQKWDREFAQKIIEDYRDLTRGYVESSDFDLVIWPETALPGRWTFPWVQAYLNEIILPGADFSLILGIEDETFDGEGNEAIYNCLGVVRGSTRNSDLHRKIHRVPFGEYLPFRKQFPPIEWIAGGIVPMDFSAGESFEPLTLEKPEVDIIPLICFEDTLGRVARRFVRPGPQLLVNITNDGWFYESNAALQHMANAKFRCIELRRPMARAANTGVSGFIDENGSLEYPDAGPGASGHERLRVVQDPLTGNTFTTGTLPATVTLRKHPPITFYARFGDAFSVTLGLIALAFSVVAFIRARIKLSN
ncbi:MAG: apolipoprotein N-acyltransferase [Verrucomicrobiae bacterium]|nr:apolipoprotein N-acyltransferase [Verrucomicrobiae bacterium]